MLKPWKCEGVAKDSKVSASGKHAPFENFGEKCAICTLPREEVVGASPSSSGKGVAIAAVIGVLAALGLGSWLFFKPKPCPDGQQTVNGVCMAVTPSPTVSPSESVVPSSPLSPSVSLTDRSSSGEHVLFTFKGNPDRDRGAEMFAKGDYDQAIQFFQKAVDSSPNDPEAQIYLNNAKARKQGNPYVLAAVVPVTNKATSAEEILRGIAEAQTTFNDSGNTRLVEIMVVDDGNDPDTAASLASQLVAKSQVLGVIGHNSSDASAAALPVYEKANLAMISPTSTSTKLKGSTFFRTVPSDAASGKVLAEYVTTQHLQKVAAFFDSQSNYSKSLLSAFKENFIGKVVQEFDLTDTDPEKSISESVKQEAAALLLFPSTKSTSTAISVARANASRAKLPLLGGDALYNPDTLINGRDSVAGIVLAVPWFANTPYAEKAKKRWGGQASWRTASSFDAAQAMIKTLSDSVSRSSILQALKTINIPDTDTSGQTLQFTPEGDRAEEPLLVRAIRGGNRPKESEFGFELIQ